MPYLPVVQRPYDLLTDLNLTWFYMIHTATKKYFQYMNVELKDKETKNNTMHNNFSNGDKHNRKTFYRIELQWLL